MKRFILLLGLLGLCGISLALILDVNIDTNAWEGSSRSTKTATMITPGAPMLPYYPVRVLIPFGEKVLSVQVTADEPVLQRSGVALDYARQQQPTSMSLPDNTMRDPLIWEQNALYPARDQEFLGTQFQRGYQYAVIDLYPWKYNPVAREIYAHSSLRIEIQTEWDEAIALEQANFYTPALAEENLRGFALNTEAKNSYQAAPQYRTHAPGSRLIDLSYPKKMIIITNTASAPFFQNYATWRSSSNVSTAVYLTSDIYSAYTGVDNAQKVRNFIIDAYQTWATTSSPLEYVILGGDDEIVPERGCYGQVGDTVDLRMPTDIYFSNLDGSWNADGDQIWGEPNDQVDMLPEVHIGRFPAETQAEFDNICRKTQYYVDNATFSNNIAIMFGENLNNNPLTWGGDYKDDVATHIPDSYLMRTMYQRDGTYSAEGVWQAINQGAHVMNHMGHANETFLLGQGNNTIEQLNNSEYGFLYSQGCYPAAFDQRTSGDGESIAEHLSTTDGGLFAFIGNTRYGWYMPGGINGASQFYDRQYFIGLYETLNTQFGKALTFSREQNLNAAMANDVMRWCYYEVVLFGDPSIEVKYPDPSLPLLSLDNYTITDVDGDGDGSFNPGEILRIYPVIRNHQDWAAAYNVSAHLEDLPAGVQLLGPPLLIPSLQPGQTSDPTLYISIQLPQNVEYGSYTIRLELESIHPISNLSTGIRNFSVGYDLTLIDGNFPWDCQISTKSAPIVYDFDGDNSLDIMYLDVYGSSYLLNGIGLQFGGFSPTEQQDIKHSSALGDITGDAIPEIAYGSRTGRLTVISANGTPVFTYEGGSQFLYTPVIANIDGLGNAEVIAATLDGRIHVLNSSGTNIAGFPLDLGPAILTEIAVADINADGLMEIIAGTSDGNLHVIQANGTPLAGFPYVADGLISGGPSVLNTGAIAFGTNTRVYVVSPQGILCFRKTISAAMASSPALADIDADGNLDIVFGTIDGNVYALNQVGYDLPGWPQDTGAIFFTPPLIADLGGDNHLEILMSSYVNSVYAFTHDGFDLDGFPFQTSFNGATPGTICDLDGDGWLKLVSGYSTGVLVLNLRSAETANMPWVTYRGSLSRQGSYAATAFVANADNEAPVLSSELLQNYPNPFNPSTTLRFQIASDGPAKLSIYNLKGQLVRLLSDSYFQKGTHQMVWDGLDSSGKTVSSGVYLYRLQTAEGTLSKRMLMLK